MRSPLEAKWNSISTLGAPISDNSRTPRTPLAKHTWTPNHPPEDTHARCADSRSVSRSRFFTLASKIAMESEDRFRIANYKSNTGDHSHTGVRVIRIDLWRLRVFAAMAQVGRKQFTPVFDEVRAREYGFSSGTDSRLKSSPNWKFRSKDARITRPEPIDNCILEKYLN